MSAEENMVDMSPLLEQLREANLRLDTLIRSMPDVVFFKDAQGCYLLANPAAEKFMGIAQVDLLGRSDDDLLSPDLAEYCRKSDLRVAEGLLPVSGEEYFRQPDGVTRVFETIKAPIMDDSGGFAGLVGVAREITERKRNEEALQSANCSLKSQLQFTETLLQTIPLAVFYKDCQGRYLGCNSSFTEMLGVGRENIVGKTVFELWPEELAAVYHQHDQELLQNPRHQCYEFKLKNHHGEVKDVIYSKNVFRDEAGQVAGIIGAFLDISERKRAETALRELNETLERRVEEEVSARQEKEQLLIQQSKYATMGQMIGAIAHQWRQPLNRVGLIAQNLRSVFRQGELEQAQLDQDIGEMMAQLQHMSRTIDDFRNFFKPTQERAPFQVNQAIAETLRLVAAQLADNFITLEYQSGTVPLVTYGYANEFKHVLMNLLINAMDALQEVRSAGNRLGGEVGKIWLETQRQGELIAIIVRDNAGGIPTGIIERIFEPYFTTKSSGKGTGIGLYMAKNIIERNMGGSITAHNVPHGAEFRIEINAAPAGAAN